MQKSIVLSLILALGPTLALAQRTRTETVHPTTPAEDSKANSASVPDVYAINTQFQRIVILRFKYKTDLLAGLEKAVKEQKIKNAVILAGAGSLRNYHIHTVGNSTFPSKNIYIKDPTMPVDLASMNGYVIDGRVHTHVMITYADQSFGGHLEPGSEVFTFAILTLGVLADGADLSRIDDKTYR